MEKFKSMSTPKEKAKDLVDKMYSARVIDFIAAKQVALIACDEILSNNPIALVGNAGKFIYMNEYWQQVKTEIENL